jgi:uncharacterized protein (TIGR03435 family)
MRPTLTIALVLSSLAFGQAPKRLEFEVATVRPSGPVQTNGAQTPAAAQVDPSQIRLTYLTMRDFITRAYRVRAYQVDGPDWIASERYDISAKVPAGATTAQVPEMLQALLEDCFGLKIHRSQKQFTVYTLERNKKPFTMTEVEPRDSSSGVTGVAPRAGNGLSLNTARGGLFTFADNKMEGKGVSMDVLSNQLTGMMGMPIVNSTGLTAFYDFSLDVNEEDFSVMMARTAMTRGVAYPPELALELAAATTPSFIAALDKMGLKLEKGQSPLEVVVIDNLKKIPTEN